MPAADTDLRPAIAAALAAFGAQPLHAAALGFFQALGYDSDRRLRVEPATPQNFLTTLAPNRTLGPSALLVDWKAAEFLFQVTTDEVRALAQGSFKFGERGGYEAGTYESYLFVALQLAQPRYNRTQLAGVVREVNRLFPQPVLVLLRHGDTVSLGIVHRRPGKRDATRDVLEKVTLIMDISAGSPDREPLRAHVEILSQFSLDELQAEWPFHDFAGLHAAWEKRLATYQLNEQFYRDIANWYFWALKPDTGIVYPRDVRTEEERSIFLIRLLTRLIFCWFLQEKGLIPRDLFRRHIVKRLLKDASPHAGTYYRAVLQNLFFATLNQEMDKRGFRRKSATGHRDGNRGVTGLFRYAALLADADALTAHLDEIPFLNGGLFDCLDRVFTTTEKKTHGAEDVRLDDFSEEKSNALHLPNDLFFGDDRLVNLTHIYADPKQAPKRPIEENVAGLITILSRYKFTVVENTPFEEEIALDPELLGKVFENLLASYNEDTRTTARKATGSFYTPREIVSYMVDEALRAYLEAALGLRALAAASKENPPGSLGPVQTKLKALFDPAQSGNPFDEKETTGLIDAIDRVKILDPACGSGAFPMGALHRLTDLLAKLDPNNRRWKEQQLRKVERDRQLAAQMEDEELRQATLTEADDRAADIERSFNEQFHDLDFARKLYLIENCIYGVDIQPIATQIAKLRFFIALIVDQRHDPAAPNRGVRPLPNLETKLVAADFLIPIERHRTQGGLFDDDTVALRTLKDLREKLAQVRHEHFSARDPRKKERCRAEDAWLREEMAALLSKTTPQSEQMAKWDPYDQNTHAPFFDSEWMFNLPIGRIRLDVATLLTLRGNFSFLNEATGQMELPAGGREVESGFDIVVGNPPYGARFSKEEKLRLIEIFPKARKVLDSYFLFVLAGTRIIKEGGTLGYILPNTFCDLENGEEFRRHLLTTLTIASIWQSGWVFSAAVVDTLVLMLKNGRASPQYVFPVLKDDLVDFRTQSSFSKAPLAKIDFRTSSQESDLRSKIEARCEPLSSEFYVKAGVKMYEEGKGMPPQSRSVVDQKPFSTSERQPKGWRGLYRGADIAPFQLDGPEEFVNYGPWLAAPRSSELFEPPKILMRRTDDHLRSCLDETDSICVNSCHVIKLHHEDKFSDITYKFTLGILNSRACQWIFEKNNPQMIGKTFAEIKVVYVERLPLPPSETAMRRIISLPVEYLLWLHRQPEVTAGREPRDPVMLAFWEQVVNALVYELFFPAELAAARLAFFRLVDEAGLKALAKLPTADGRKTCINDVERLNSLRTTFERLSASNHPLAAALFSLGGLDFVRLIEDRE